MGGFFPLGLGARRRSALPLTLFTPGDDWNGALGSGFTEESPAPVDPTRTTTKPGLRMITVPNQHFTTTLDVGVIAMANDSGTLIENFGIKEVTFYYEGRVRTVRTPRWQAIQTERGTRLYFGWWVRLSRPIGLSGKARLYVEAEANDATMQKRVIGPFNFSPVDTEYDLDLEINPDLTEIPGQRYQSMWPAIVYARSQLPHNPRFLFTKAGKYEIERNPATNAEVGTDQYAITGRYTIEASVPGVSIGRLSYETDALALIPAHRTYWRFRGSNLTYDIKDVRNISARVNQDDIGHWMDGITITTSDPDGKNELFRGSTTPRGAQLVSGFPYYTEVVGRDLNTAARQASLVRGCDYLDLSQDVISDCLCVVSSTFGRMDQNFWNSNVGAFTVTIPTGDTLERIGGNNSSGANGGLWQATVSGVLYTFDVGNGSEAYFQGTATYRGVSGIGGYWVSDVAEWLNTLPGWSASLSETFIAKDRVASALSRPGLKGQGFSLSRGTAIVGNGTPQQIVWNIDTHGDWYQHTRGIIENVIVAFNTAFDMQCQALFLSPILGQGGTPAATRDFFFVGNAFSNSNIVRDSFNPDNASTQLSRPQTMSHTVIAHNTLANQNIILNFTTGNVIDGGFNLLKNNAARTLRWLGNVIASGVEIDGLLIHEGQAVPDSVSNYIVAGNQDTLFASYLTGDFTPTALLKEVGFAPAVPFDAAGDAFPSPCAPGGVAAVADELLDQADPPAPVEILGPDGLALVSALSDTIHGGFWVAEGASNPGLFRMPNFGGDAGDMVQGTATNQPAIDGIDLVFDVNDQLTASLFAGQYTFYLLVKKDAASTAGQLILNQIIYLDGSASAAAVSAAAKVFVNGVRVLTRDALFEALDVETGGDTDFAEVRVEGLTLGQLNIGRAAGDALLGRLRAVIAIPEFTPSTPDEGVEPLSTATLRALARDALLELEAGLPEYPAIPPVITALGISGIPTDGEVLTAVFDIEGEAPLTTTIEWEFNGSPIVGETSETITLDEAGMGLFEGGVIAVNLRTENAGGIDEARAEIAYDEEVGPPIVGFVGATSVASGDDEDELATVIFVPHPDTQVGDTLIAVLQAATGVTFTAPSGWTLAALSGLGGATYTREHNGSASYSFEPSSDFLTDGVLLTYRGYAYSTAGAWNASSSINPAAPAIASGIVADSLHLVAITAGTFTTTYDTPSGFTLRGAKNDYARSIAVFEADAPIAGPSTSAVTVTRSAGSGQGRAMQLTLEPV